MEIPWTYGWLGGTPISENHHIGVSAQKQTSDGILGIKTGENTTGKIGNFTGIQPVELAGGFPSDTLW